MIAAAVMSLAAFGSCKDMELTVTDPVLAVNAEAFQAEAGIQVMQVEVTSNCEWVVLKQDYDGNEASWIQTDRQKGKGNATLGIRVLQNKVQESRQGQVIIKAEGAKAFIAVFQAAADPLPEPEPEPEPEPDPDPQELTLFLDFMDVAAFDWPTSKAADWSKLKNCDSGLAGDNGGTATDNTRRRAQVTYTVNGVGYDFTFADPDGATGHNIYLQPSGGLYSGTRRHFGLPAIEGRKLVKLVMVQGASTKDPASFNRGIGLTTQIYDATCPQADMEYVKGGEPQNQCVNMETYTYELTGTKANTMYYLSSPYNASIVVSLELVYEKAEEPQPKPEDLELAFEFNSALLPDWPTDKAADWSKLKNCDSGLAGDNGGTATDNTHRRAQVTYTLDGVGYDFTFADPDEAVAHNIFLQKNPKTGIYSGTGRYLGLPAIEHRRLVKLVMIQGASTKDPASFSRGVGLTSQIYDASAKAGDMQFVAGGELQNQCTNKGEYTYEFTGTVPNTVYWLCSPENASIIESMTLVYEYVD